MRATRSVILILVLVIIGSGFRESDPATQLIQSLQNWLGENPVEKVYLFTDKPIYAPGESIWYRAWLVNGLTHTANSPSGVLYVELFGPDRSVIATQRVRVESSATLGDIALPDTITAGTYRLRAYTQWMRNAGEAYFFDRTITVAAGTRSPTGPQFSIIKKERGDSLFLTLHLPRNSRNQIADGRLRWTLINDDTPIGSENPRLTLDGSVDIAAWVSDSIAVKDLFMEIDYKGDIQRHPVPQFRTYYEVALLPEGGNLIEGLPSRVAVQVTDRFGKAVSVQGFIQDDRGHLVTEFSTEKDGIAIVELMPEAGRSYRANVPYQALIFRSSEHRVMREGVSLYVDGAESDIIPIQIQASHNIQQPLMVLGHVRGEVGFMARSTPGVSEFTAQIPRTRFRSGWVHITVFDANGSPLAERLVFNDVDDVINTTITTSKPEYSTRELVRVDIETRSINGDAALSDMAVSVTSEALVPDSLWRQMDIKQWLLAGSDLEGGVTWKSGLDLASMERVALTKGWRRFNWSTMADQANMALYEIEDGFTMRGKVVDNLTKRAARNQELTVLIAGKAIELVKTQTNGEGFFSIPFHVTDTTHIVLQTRNSRGRSHYEIRLDAFEGHVDASERIGVPLDSDARSYFNYLMAAREKLFADREYGLDPNYKLLGEITVEAQRDRDINEFWFKPSIRADWTVKPSDLKGSYTSALDMVRGAHAKFVLVNDEVLVLSRGSRTAARIFIDGVESDALEARSLPIEWVDHMDLIWDLSNLISTSFLGEDQRPIVAFYTKRDRTLAPNRQGLLNAIHPGYYAARDFYAPNYAIPDSTHEKIDNRITLAWHPIVRTDLSGKSSIEFWTGDIQGTYTIRVEGLTEMGKPIVASQQFSNTK